MERFAVPQEQAPTAPVASSRLTWVYSERLLGECGVGLNRFGERGSAQLGGGLVTSVWNRFAPNLRENGPRSHSLAAV